MAADQFTQIANGLFRDSRLSYKAKGIFGYVSTHRDGWQVTLAHLVAVGPDGREAVRAGLKELERYGYLIRERLRRPNGTLGEVVYSITDRPVTLDVALLEATSTLAIEDEHDVGFGAGIRRGVMAADQFTQIANGLFRDPKLSFKAKGIFGYVSTHRDGWQVTVAELVRRGREGVDAVATGLHQLERHGFLYRTRERNPDGTLGQALYFITDLPGLQTPGRNQSRVFQDWLSLRWLIPALRTPRERRPTSRTPDPSVRAAANRREHLDGRASQSCRLLRQPRPWRMRCTRGSCCCSNSGRLAPSCC
ncbi:hypothetical protein GCM10023336_67460 [Streptomyces similanensis]|uniref:Uncharacterized protein n=2 Tax=Streptomyces similanensis TaxID=1274988 RepID=A0ABP9LET9_9ACTN